VRRQRTAESWTDRWTELRHGAVERSRRRTNAPLRQGIWASAPPGTRTRTRGLRAPNPVISFGFGLCQLVSFPQVSNEPPGHRMPSSAAPVHGHRALMEHRDRRSVLHRRTRWGSASTAQAADLGSAGSVVAVTRTVARCGRIGGCRPRRSRTAGWVVQPTGGVEKTNAIESRAAVRALRRSAVVDPVPPLCRLSVGAFLQGGRGAARRPVPSSDRRPPPPSTRRRQTDDVAIRYGT
jgi:hypothetical protein